ncbi:MAG: Rho termination protein [Leptolyngbya foveolarum]|uniref:Rho termination protein n=1 Tax=Leptolyngbya foveolarum TaxID=47253 RepID=A0A2W4TS63_9CYAN|nr:MAG: Rho termination protein [Leptolyngbya foveolarum]
MIIAETNDVPDIEPDSQTIIGDSAVIFGGAAADVTVATSALSQPAIAPISLAGSIVSDAGDITSAAATEDTSPDADIDSFFSATADEPEIALESREDTLEAGLSPVLKEPVLEEPVSEEPVLDSTVILGSAAAGIAGGIVNTIPLRSETEQSSKTEPSSVDTTTPLPRSYTVEELASVDEDLLELPEGYGDRRIVLLPRDPKWAYAYWDISNEHKDELRRQGGQRLALRLYDVTEIDQTDQTPHSMQQQDCDEMARSWYLEIPVSDRDYTVEIGYLTDDSRWLMLARSAPVRVPPIYPSDWINDQFVTIGFGEPLADRTVGDLGRQPSVLDGDSAVEGLPPIYGELFAMTQEQNALRIAGSLFGSMHQVAPEALSPSGNLSGLNMSGLNVSGLNLPNVGLGRKRNFWLVADAELIVHGETEPNATLTVGDRAIPLSPDGTFRFHVPFPDGKMEFPIRAIAVDGEQTRTITMKFERDTPERNTNPKEDAQDEGF